MTVYLLHLDTPMDQGPDPRTGKPRAAAHYIGFAKCLEARLERHANGHGARMLQVARERGISWQVARIWEEEDKNFERRLKNTHNARRYCPLCTGDHTQDYQSKPRTP